MPLELRDLTAEWFTAVLERHVPDVGVVQVEIVDAHSGTTGRAAVSLRYRDDCGLPDRLFVKLAPFDERQREFIRRVGIGAAEARIYARLGAELPVRIPRVWHARVDDDGNYVCVLEDVVASGGRFPRPSDADIAAVAHSTVAELARLHAAYWESDRFGSELSWVPDRAGFGANPTGGRQASNAAGSFVARALDLFAADMPPAFRTVGRAYVEHTAAVLDLWDEGERTLVHGDPHMGNMFVDGARAGFFDWAMFSHSPGMRDVAYFCCNSIPTEVRRSIEGELLSVYRDGLGSAGVALGNDVVEEQYRLFCVYSWVSAVSTAAMGARWQPERLAHGAMQRTTQALADLDVPELLARRLGGSSS
ncbi:MAG: phosphotransferase [Actinobacteria bacterium]|nr:phosphotransferase [Actinomycetota bacterium]